MKKICEKCGYENEENKELKLSSGRKQREIFLCSVCSKFIPADNELKNYVKEKLNWGDLESFRNFAKEGRRTTFSMEKKAKSGGVVSRAAFGYKIENKQLVIDPEKSLFVQKIFMDFLSQDISLNQLAKKYGFSVNGIKKILNNFTYIGKVKFAGQISQGKHEPIISPELFNKVQEKLENLKKEK